MTQVPPAMPASWYSRTRPCTHCLAQVLTRLERADGTVALRVSHAVNCVVGGRGDFGRARPKGRQDAGQSAAPPAVQKES